MAKQLDEVDMGDRVTDVYFPTVHATVVKPVDRDGQRTHLRVVWDNGQRQTAGIDTVRPYTGKK